MDFDSKETAPEAQESNVFSFQNFGISETNSSSTSNISKFRQALRYFLLHFSLNDEYIYRNKIRQMELCTWKYFDAPYNAAKSRSIPSISLDLEHLSMRHWIPELHGMTDQENTYPNYGDEDDSSSKMSYDNSQRPSGDNKVSWSELLVHSFQRYPLQYLKVAEDVIKLVYFELLPPKDQERCLSVESSRGSGLYTHLSNDGVTSSLDDSEAASSINVSPSSLSLFQLELISRHRMTQIRELDASYVETLIVTPGIVVQAYKPIHKALRIKLRCKHCETEKTMSLPLWKEQIEIPKYCLASAGGNRRGATEMFGADQARCPVDPYMILSDESVYCDVQTIKLQELPEQVSTGDMPRHVVLNAANALCGRVIPGQRVIVVGVYTTSMSQKHQQPTFSQSGTKGMSTYVHVLGFDFLDQAKYRNSNLLFPLYAEEKQLQALANDPDIYEKIFNSIAPSLFGMSDIKKSIACLLFGGSRKKLPDGTSLRGDINILLLGDPSTAKSQFLKFVEKVAPVAVYTSGKGSSAAGLTAAVVRDTNKNFALEGGAMVLADGGVVCIDEFDKMRDDDRVSIHEAMEQQTISIAKAGITTILKTRCSVLAAANPTFGSYDDSKETTDQHDFETTILSRFDLIWLVRDVKDAQRDQSVAKHIVQLHLGRAAIASATNTGPIPLNLFRNYIHYCRSVCNPVLSTDAAKKLENYYVEVRSRMRRDKRRQRDQIPITLRQLESLSRIAESLARMKLSRFVTTQHVEEAIHLFNLSTLETAKSSSEKINSWASIEEIHAAESAILHRLPVNNRASKSSIIRELQLRGLDPTHVTRALVALIHKGILEERGDASVRRVAGIA